MSDITDIQKELDEHIRTLETNDAAFLARKEVFQFLDEDNIAFVPVAIYTASILVVFFIGFVVGNFAAIHSMQHYVSTVHPNATQLVDTIAGWG
jgi:hypothetical protein